MTSIQTAEEQARTLAHALPFLRRYAGATVVVKYGGHAMGEEVRWWCTAAGRRSTRC